MSDDSNVPFVLVWDGIVCMHVHVCRVNVSVLRCTVNTVYMACNAVSTRMLVANSLGNGGGISVAMEMSKLICNKILT